MESRYVGIELHRRRSVIYTMDGDGEKLDCVRNANDPMTLSGADAEVVIEATYGWYWAVDLLQDRVHLAAETHTYVPALPRPVDRVCVLSARSVPCEEHGSAVRSASFLRETFALSPTCAAHDVRNVAFKGGGP